MALKKKLMADKQKTYFMSEDIPFELRGPRQKLRNISDSAKKLGMDCKIVGNKIILNGKVYTSADLEGLTDELLDGAAQIKEVEGGLAYRGEEAFLSNFYYAPFTLDNHNFVTVEQYYQYKKCLTLGHINMAAKILRTARSLQAKSLGDKFDDTDSDDWMEERAQCMLNGMVAKFTQNPNLAVKLIDTGNVGLYEATTDRYFGAGVGLGSNLWLTRNWTGVNAAGKICMNVRSLLNHEIEHGADLQNLGEIITYPVSPTRIPGAIVIKAEGHIDEGAAENDSEGSESDLESERDNTLSDAESDMDTTSQIEGPSQVEGSSQVETKPKERLPDVEQDIAVKVSQKNQRYARGKSSGKGNGGGRRKGKEKRNDSTVKPKNSSKK